MSLHRTPAEIVAIHAAGCCACFQVFDEKTGHSRRECEVPGSDAHRRLEALKAMAKVDLTAQLKRHNEALRSLGNTLVQQLKALDAGSIDLTDFVHDLREAAESKGLL